MSDRRISTNTHTVERYHSRVPPVCDNAFIEDEGDPFKAAAIALVAGLAITTPFLALMRTYEKPALQTYEPAPADIDAAAQADGFEGVNSATINRYDQPETWTADVNVGKCVLKDVTIELQKTDQGRDITDYTFSGFSATYEFQSKAQLVAKYPDDKLCLVMSSGGQHSRFDSE